MTQVARKDVGDMKPRQQIRDRLPPPARAEWVWIAAGSLNTAFVYENAGIAQLVQSG
jgi:hypothetical protein